MLGVDQCDDVHHLRADQVEAFERGELVTVDCGDDGVRKIVSMLPPLSGAPTRSPDGARVVDADATWPGSSTP